MLATAVGCGSDRSANSGGGDVGDVGIDAPDTTPDVADTTDADTEEVSDVQDVADEPDGPFFPTVVVAVETRLSATTVQAGDSVYVHCDAIDMDGEIVALDPEIPISHIIAPATALERGEEPQEWIAAGAGNAAISCAIPSLSLIDPTPAELVIDPGAPYTILTEVDSLTTPVGQPLDVTCTAYDFYGNYIPDAEMDVLVAPFREGVEVFGRRLVIWLTGIYEVTCSAIGAADLISETIEVQAGLPCEITVGVIPDKPVYAVGDVVSLTWTVLDRLGNIVPSPPVRFSSAPTVPGFGEGRFRFDTEGLFRLSTLVLPPTDPECEADGGPIVGSVELIVNERGPTIECDFPIHGAMVDGPPGAPVLIEGSTEDEFGVAAVEINGTDADLRPDGTFITELPGAFGLNFLHIEAFDELGGSSKRTCVYLMADQWIEEAGFFDDDIALELTQEAFDDRDPFDAIDSLNDIIYTILNAPTLESQLNDMMLAANPLFPRTCVLDSWFGCLVRVGVDFRFIRIGGPHDTALTLVEDGLRLSVDLRDMEIGLRITGTFGTSGEIEVSNFGLTMTLNVDLTGGRPRVNVRSVDRVDVGSLDSDFSGLTGFVIDILFDIFEGTIRNLLRDQLRSFIEEEVSNLLDEMFAGLDISTFGDTIEIPRLDGTGTIDLGFGMRFSNVDFTPARGLFGLGTRFTAAITHGGFTLGAARPPGPAVHPDPPERTVKVGINLGLLNQMLHTLWRASLFDVSLTSGDVGGSLPAGLDVALYAALPPVVVGLEGDDIEFQLGAFQVVLTYPELLPGPITFDLGAKVKTGVDVLPGDEIDFRDFEITDFYFDALDASLDAETATTLEDFMVEVVQYIVDSVLNSALPTFPIPTFELPADIAEFGLPPGATMGITDAALNIDATHFLLQGNFGIR